LSDVRDVVHGGLRDAELQEALRRGRENPLAGCLVIRIHYRILRILWWHGTPSSVGRVDRGEIGPALGRDDRTSSVLLLCPVRNVHARRSGMGLDPIVRLRLTDEHQQLRSDVRSWLDVNL